MHIDTDKALAWLDQLREGVENENSLAEEVVTRAMAAGQVVKALEVLGDYAKDRAADAPEWRDHDTVSIPINIGDLRKATAALNAAYGEKP